MMKHVDPELVRIGDLQKAQSCKNQNTPMTDPKRCEHCHVQKVFCDDNKARRLCELSRDDLLTIACRKQEIVDAENARLRAIIAKHLDGDRVCACCKHLAQCKIEAEEESDAAAQSESRFWSCDGISKFEPSDKI